MTEDGRGQEGGADEGAAPRASVQQEATRANANQDGRPQDGPGRSEREPTEYEPIGWTPNGWALKRRTPSGRVSQTAAWPGDFEQPRMVPPRPRAGSRLVEASQGEQLHDGRPPGDIAWEALGCPAVKPATGADTSPTQACPGVARRTTARLRPGYGAGPPRPPYPKNVQPRTDGATAPTAHQIAPHRSRDTAGAPRPSPRPDRAGVPRGAYHNVPSLPPAPGMLVGLAVIATLAVIALTGCFELEDPALVADSDPDHWTIDPSSSSGLTVDDGCPEDEPPAYAVATEVQLEGWRRINCYRSLAGLDGAALTEGANKAASRHALYQDETGEYGMVESDPSAEHYSGYDTLARMSAAGEPVDLSLFSVQEMVVRAPDDAAVDVLRAVDTWIDTVYHRPPLMRPRLDALGVGVAGSYADAVAVGPWDTVDVGGGLAASRYPVPGQGDVPPSFSSDHEYPDPAPGVDEVGYPVSVTFQTDVWFGGDNPFDIALVPDGCAVRPVGGAESLPLILLEPATDPALMATAVLMPEQPLEPYKTYVVQIEATVAGVPWRDTWTFTTGAP